MVLYLGDPDPQVHLVQAIDAVRFSDQKTN